ncbi:MAG: hypothetical protein R2706_11730 [Acidimicrobiales bacterium]
MIELVHRSMAGASRTTTPDFDAHHELAREAARASAVLLRTTISCCTSRRDVLRLKIAVIGEFARTPRFQGAGSSKVNPTRVDSALDALIDATAGAASVAFAPGVHDRG